MLDHITATANPDAPSGAIRSLADRDEFGPITGRPGGLFTAPSVPLALEPCDELGRRIVAWVPDACLL